MSKKKPAKKTSKRSRTQRPKMPAAGPQNYPVRFPAVPRAPEPTKNRAVSAFDEANERLAGAIGRTAELTAKLRSRLDDFLGPGPPSAQGAAPTGEGGPPALARVAQRTAEAAIVGDGLADILDRLVV